MKSSLDPTAFASRAMEVALRAGADETDAYVRSSSHLSIEVRNGEIESLRRAATFGLGLRVKVDDHNPQALFGKRSGDVHHRCRFAYAALLIYYRNSSQLPAYSTLTAITTAQSSDG